MNEISLLMLAFTAGFVFGIFFFGGLWWTIQKGLYSKMPELWFLGSGIIRTIIVLTGFYFVGTGSWQKMLACFLGFFIARILSTFVQPKQKDLYES